MPASTSAAVFAKSAELFRLSYEIATLRLPSVAFIRFASACVVCPTVYTFMREIPAPITLRSPAVPKRIGSANLASISASSPEMDSSSRLVSSSSPSYESQYS